MQGMNKTMRMRLFLVLMMVGSAEVYADSKSKITLTAKARTKTTEEETADVREDRNGDETTTTTETETEICTLHIDLKNKDAVAYDECTLEWYFISNNIRGRKSEENKIFGSGSKKISLPAKGAVQESVISEPFVFSTVSRDRGDQDDQEIGDVYEGYIIFLISNGKVVAQKSSSSRYAKPEWLDKCSKMRRRSAL